ncbi:unnamed protein product [Closterium sp. NIES-65]|nr:unnamed protein product [Closterium sp. NIES-65]
MHINAIRRAKERSRSASLEGQLLDSIAEHSNSNRTSGRQSENNEGASSEAREAGENGAGTGLEEDCDLGNEGHVDMASYSDYGLSFDMVGKGGANGGEKVGFTDKFRQVGKRNQMHINAFRRDKGRDRHGGDSIVGGLEDSITVQSGSKVGERGGGEGVNPSCEKQSSSEAVRMGIDGDVVSGSRGGSASTGSKSDCNERVAVAGESTVGDKDGEQQAGEGDAGGGAGGSADGGGSQGGHAEPLASISFRTAADSLPGTEASASLACTDAVPSLPRMEASAESSSGSLLASSVLPPALLAVLGNKGETISGKFTARSAAPPSVCPLPADLGRQVACYVVACLLVCPSREMLSWLPGWQKSELDTLGGGWERIRSSGRARGFIRAAAAAWGAAIVTVTRVTVGGGGVRVTSRDVSALITALTRGR